MVTFGMFSPLAGKLNARLGERALTIFGAIVCAAGLMLSSQAPSLNVMYITLGVIPGFGSSCIFLAVFMIVSKYFLEKRSLALGILSLGSSAAVALISPLVQSFFDALDWRHSFMCLAGVMLLVCFFAISFDPNVTAEAKAAECEPENAKEHATTCSVLASLATKPAYVIFLFSAGMAYAGHLTPNAHLVGGTNMYSWTPPCLPDKQTGTLTDRQLRRSI